MKRYHLVICFSLFFIGTTHTVGSKNILEAVFRKLDRVRGDTDTTLGKVCNIQTNAVEILEKVCDIDTKVDGLSVTDVQVSGIEELSQQISILGETLCSKIEDIQIPSVTDVQVSGIEELSQQISILEENLCSKLEELSEQVSLNDTLILSSIDNITIPPCQVSGIDEVVSASDELLCSKIENISTVLCSKIDNLVEQGSLNDVLILSSIDMINLSCETSGLEEIVSSSDVLLCSKIDSLLTTVTVGHRSIESQIEDLDIDIQSTTDILCNKSILTQSAIDALASGQGFVSTFGESIISPIDDMINIQFQYGISCAETSTTLISTGTAFPLDSMAVISTGAASDGEATIQSNRNLRYRTGHEGYAFFTAIFESNAANSTQWIGLFDDADGAAVGYNGTTFSILFRRDGEADTTIPQSSFNGDPLDGTGSSGFTIDTTKMNIFRISYGWLGTAPIKFQICKEDGTWITFHVIERPNTSTGPHFINPVLPVRAQVKNNGNTSDLQLKTASWNAGIVGSPSTAGHRFFSKGVLPSITIPDSETHMLTIRNKTTFQGRPNKVEVRITALGGGPTKTGSDAMILRLRRNATVTGTSFYDFDVNDSVIEVSESGTFSAGTGQETFLLPSNSTGGPVILFIPQDNFTIILLPGESMTITGISIPMSGTADAIATISWEERF